MQVRVLGPVDSIDDAGSNVSLGGSMPVRLLALLVAARGDVGIDDLVAELWPGDDRPNDPIASLRTYVARLRSNLGPESVLTGTGAYALGDVDTDAKRFEELVERARRASGSPVVAELWKQAVSLWRGPAFAGHDDPDSVRREAQRLEELRAEATEAWFDARLAAGEGRELAADVDAAIGEFPLREGFRAQQMTVLSRAGRQAEALRAFQEFRGDLTEIGLAPSERLVELESQIAVGEVPRAGARRTLRGYELGDRLGEGAFAIVHAATQASVGRPVAIKQIRSELADQPEFIRQFEAEAQVVARLEHPHIVPLYDYWRDPGSAYLVMRYLEGGSLGSQLVDGELELDRLVPMIGQVAAGLDAAHQAGVIHRDVKPANILLDTAGNAYLSDFGIAVEEQERLDPEAWLSNGSPVYAAPEQLERKAVGPTADVYALGVTTYEALTNQVPFPGETTMAGLLARQLNDPIPLVRSTHPDVPAAIDSVIQKATAKAPHDRHSSAFEFARDLLAAAGLEGDQQLIEPEDRNPYKGLQAFDESDAGDFNGRDRLVSQLVEAVEKHRGVLVVGPSGSGKSSAVRAGLLPRLRGGAIEGSERWFVSTMTPGADPFADLEAALLRVAVDPPPDLARELRSSPTGLAKMLRRLVPDDGKFVLVVDQFEELFTLSGEASRHAFLDGLVAALTDDHQLLRLVMTLRADFYDHPLRHPEFAQLVRHATVPVHPLAADELERAITEPARAVGTGFEPGLVAEITADVADQPGALPLLQYALTELYDRRSGEVMTKHAYAELGGVTGALARRAEEVFAESDAPTQQAARRVFGRLVSLGEGTEDTRRRVVRSELGSDQPTDAVLARFDEARLLAFDRDATTREPTVEVAHEALIREWPRLRSWLDEDRDGLRIHRHLTDTSSAWDQTGREQGELYRGGRLEAAEEWSADHGDDLNPTEATFLAASVDLRDEERAAEERSTRRLRRLLAGVAVVAALALVASVVAFQQRGLANESAAEAQQSAEEAQLNAELADEQTLLAEEQAEVAEEQSAIALSNAELAETNAATAETRRIIADAASLTDENYEIALLLASEGYNRDPSPAGLAGLQRVLVESGNFLGRLGAGTPYFDVYWTENHLVGLTQTELHFFDEATGQISSTMELPAPALVDFFGRTNGSALENTVSIVLEGGLVAIVNLTTSKIETYEHNTGVAGVALNADATQLAVGDVDRTLALVQLDGASTSELWRTTGVFTEESFDEYAYPAGLERGPVYQFFNSANLAPLLFGQGLNRVVFDEAGNVVAGMGGTLARFDGNTGAQLARSQPFVARSGELIPFPPLQVELVNDEIIARTFISAFTLTAALGVDEVRQIETGRQDGNVFPTDSVFGDDFSHVSILGTGQLSTGYSATGDGIDVPEVQTQTLAAGPTALALNPSRRIAAITTPNGIVLTSLAGDRLLAQAVPREGHLELRVTPNGSHGVTQSLGSGRQAVIYDLREDPPRVVQPATDHPLEVIRFGPKGIGIGGVYTDNLTLIDAERFDEVLKLPLSGDFGDRGSPDGRLFVLGRNTTIAERPELVFFDLESGLQVGTMDMSEFMGETEAFLMSAFSLDGSRLFTTTRGGRVFTIDPAARQVLDVREPSEDGNDSIIAITFSPDGDIAATRNLAGGVDIRDAETLELLWSLIGGTSAAELVSPGPFFSPDGRYLLTTRGVLPRLWDLEARTDLGSFPNEAIANGMPGPDQLYLTSLVGDHALVWNVVPETWPDIACQAAGRNMTPEEWEQFGPSDQDYRATCPHWPSLE